MIASERTIRREIKVSERKESKHAIAHFGGHASGSRRQVEQYRKIRQLHIYYA